jgi:hypothetical protein
LGLIQKTGAEEICRQSCDFLSLQGGATTAAYLQNGFEYPSPYNFSIYTDYLKALQQCIPSKNKEED